MSSVVAKTHHLHQWAFIHKAGCQILGINADQECDRFMSMAKFIADFTDKHNRPPRKQDFLSFA